MNLNGLTVRELLELPVMQQAKLVSGEQGLDRIVRYIDIWEVPDIRGWLREGEMILTTGYSTRNEPALLVGLIEQLALVNGAGVAIKLERFIDRIPQEMIDKSNEYHVPVIQLPTGMPYIDITYSVMEQILNRQAVLLKRSEEVYRALTGLVLSNKGIQVVADSVSELIHSPIWLLDKEGEVVVASPSGHPLALSGSNRQWEVHGDNKTWGKLVVGKRNLDELELMLIEQARLVFSLELMRNKIAEDTERRLRGTFFEELILNPAPDKQVTESRGVQLELAPEWIWRVAVIEADQPFIDYEAPAVSEMNDFIIKESAARKVHSHLQIHSGKMILFLPAVQTADADKWSKVLFDQVERRDGLRIGFGNPGKLHEMYKSFNEARTAVSMGYRLNKHRKSFKYDEFAMLQLLLEETDRSRLARFVEARVGKLLEHDRLHGTNYVLTLYHYLATGGSLHETANRLYIHRNSVNYRLDRIKAIARFDLGNAGTRYELYLCTAYCLLNQD